MIIRIAAEKAFDKTQHTWFKKFSKIGIKRKSHNLIKGIYK